MFWQVGLRDWSGRRYAGWRCAGYSGAGQWKRMWTRKTRPLKRARQPKFEVENPKQRTHDPKPETRDRQLLRVCTRSNKKIAAGAKINTGSHAMIAGHLSARLASATGG